MFEFGNSIFWHDENGLDYCRTYPLYNKTNTTGNCTINSFNVNITDKHGMLECEPNLPDQKIIYGEFGMEMTVVTRFGLVCKEQYKV